MTALQHANCAAHLSLPLHCALPDASCCTGTLLNAHPLVPLPQPPSSSTSSTKYLLPLEGEQPAMLVPLQPVRFFVPLSQGGPVSQLHLLLCPCALQAPAVL
jgi:hypothetical protein